MKINKYIFTIFLAGSAFILPSCTDYLDKAPESGLSENEVFEKYVNFKNFFNVVYGGRSNRNIKTAHSLYFAVWDQKHGWDTMTDIEDGGRLISYNLIKAGSLGSTINRFTYDSNRRPILDAMFKTIRVANLALENIERIQDLDDDERKTEIEDLRGQAYFVRGYALFTLAKIWGPMPYIVKSIGVDDPWDIARESKYQTFANVALDMDSAYTCFANAGRIRRDPGPGEPGHLNDPDQDKPCGVSAKALKARALLYAASPLNNQNGDKDWIDAANAAWEAITLALENKYELLPMDRYHENNYGTKYTNEQLWAWHYGNISYNNGGLQGILSGPFQGRTSYSSGLNPTQNLVDKFETKDGYPLNNEEDRAKASAAGSYKEQDPYANRDPRFYNDIIYNQAPLPWSGVNTKIGEVNNKANIFYYIDKNGKVTYSSLIPQNYQGFSHTGYYVKKYTGDMSVKNKVSTLMTDPILRLGELYLNYAEAANEAYGPNGSVPGSNLSAVAALNVIRNRANMPDVRAEFSQNKDLLRERIKNERIIELYAEGHYYFDVRRWKDAPKAYSGKLYGMDIQKVDVSAEYPTGFKYTRIILPENRQTKWKDEMYYFPFNTEDYYKMKLFDASLNPVW